MKDTDVRLVIGLMSGTSADGIDAALAEISGGGNGLRVTQKCALAIPYDAEMRAVLLRLASGEAACARDFCLINRALGERFADACEALIRKAGVPKERIACVGSHGHTFWHAPVPEAYAGGLYAATLQLGDPSPIAERLGCPVVSDFRVRDMASGGQGAPLVPYVDYRLYRSEAEDTILLNIGGIANITYLPKGCALSAVVGFDTGPGNMVMDALAEAAHPGMPYDRDGELASAGIACEKMLGELLDDEYYRRKPPKSTGREKLGKAFTQAFVRRADEQGLSHADRLATAAEFTARTICLAVREVCPAGGPDRLIAAGGGARNPHLMRLLKRMFPETRVMTQEDLGHDGDMKEAVAFAVLADERMRLSPNNAPNATGAVHPVIMGTVTV